MAPNRGPNRQSSFAEYATITTEDFDPEQDNVPDVDDDDSGSQGTGDEFDGREHYENVSQSRLRKPKAVSLGPQYRGSKIARAALHDEDEDEDDPLRGAFLDHDESDDEVLAIHDLEDSEEEDEHLEDGTDATDISDEDEKQVQRPTDELSARDQDELKHLGSGQLQRQAAKSLSQANREEADKGRAVKRQRTAFGALLNTRMKLQKSLIAANTLVGTPFQHINAERADAQHALSAAETAAFNLWTSLNSLREDLLAAKTGQKRKRTVFMPDTPTDTLCDHIEAQERESRAPRDAVLRKWSVKAQGPVVVQSNRINRTEHQATIIDVLEEQLSNSDRLLARAHAPKSCAPLQLAQRINEDDKIYDDADFYGILLKELLEQKSADSVAASNIDIAYQMRRDAKTKRNVDTKASKGRKLRYTVHEKLQNFMAPEDRTVWTEERTDALFPSLFEQNMGLIEQDEDQLADVGAGSDIVEADLRLF